MISFLRTWIQTWLGIQTIGAAASLNHTQMLALRDENAALKDRMSAVEGELKRLRILRRDQAGRTEPVLDWDQVQLVHMAMLQAEPNKEKQQ